MVVDRNTAQLENNSRLYRKAGHATMVVAVIATGLLTAKAFAHDAPTGWSYPVSCCSGYDCRPVSKAIISERPEGYVIKTTGEVVGYSDARVKYSKDSEFHWCSVGGKDSGETICLFVPPNLF